MDDQPAIVHEPHRVICAKHGQPFRADWPAGYVPFMLLALQRVLDQEGFAAYAGGEVENINSLLDEKPLCCRMSQDHRLEAYATSGIFKPGFCRICRSPARVVTIPFGHDDGVLPHAVCALCLEKLDFRRVS